MQKIIGMRIALAAAFLWLGLSACDGTDSNNGGICFGHSQCEASEICVEGSCVSPYGRELRFAHIKAVVSETNPNDEAWDTPGGMRTTTTTLRLNSPQRSIEHIRGSGLPLAVLVYPETKWLAPGFGRPMSPLECMTMGDENSRPLRYVRTWDKLQDEARLCRMKKVDTRLEVTPWTPPT